MISGNYQYKVPFKGFQEDLSLSQDIVKNLNSMHLQSNTRLVQRIEQREIAAQNGDSRSLKILPKLWDLSYEISDRISQQRDDLYDYKYNDYNDFADTLRKNVSECKAANCAEQAYLAQAELKSHSKDSKVILAHIHDKTTRKHRSNGQHMFLVMGLDKNAKVDEPGTWGQDAIVVDPWSGIVKRANQGLKMIKDLFRFDNQKEYIVFEDGDLPDNFFLNNN